MVKRGDLCWADLVPRSGSDQAGRRPIFVDFSRRIHSIVKIEIVDCDSPNDEAPSPVPDHRLSSHWHSQREQRKSAAWPSNYDLRSNEGDRAHRFPPIVILAASRASYLERFVHRELKQALRPTLLHQPAKEH